MIGFPPIADHAGALQASIAMLGALQGRTKTRRSIYLDISITESILSWQYIPLLTGFDARAESILNGGAACYNIYQCADDRFISLGAIEPTFWQNFCKAIQKNDWIDRQFENMPQHTLISEVAELIRAQSLDYWNELLDDVDCCYAPLLTPDQLATNPQLQARGSVNTSGPGYPGWVNGTIVTQHGHITEIEFPSALYWLPN